MRSVKSRVRGYVEPGLGGAGRGVFRDKRVDDGYGEGVGGVIGLRDGGEFEVDADHLLHLGLVGHAVAADGILDLVRAVFEDGEAALLGDEEADAAGFGDGDAGGDVLLEKEFLDGHDVGVVLVDDFVKGVVDVLEAVGERSVRGRSNHAIVKCGLAFDDAKTTDTSTGVDA